ncbi:hypothetical protein HELRODRAFT_66873 [Helobdella robusta]|uniref:Dynein axonemal light chain 1 n=1 Tax=Helobdella robusta TaxID=6412 RepID=T1FYS2_HELRO|nr:hypothetical protein HELRODRAFT_66873 [Helobdella robusta]ESN99037.1 hypothetical protein HELRODRAFT_66873 [Helobdella robusta]
MPTTIKEAIQKWEERTGNKASEATRVELWNQTPFIEKMDSSLNVLIKCERLSLSTNAIDKISNLNGMKNLKILSLGRNNIKGLSGIEAVSDTLEQLWISYNYIDKLKSIVLLKKLKVLYMSYNLIKEWTEITRINECPQLIEVVFIGNPIWEKHNADGDWSTLAMKRLPNIRKLDGWPCIREENLGRYFAK